MNNDTKQKQFLEMYEMLCAEYGMYIDVGCNECGTEIWQEVEVACSNDELEEHIKELKKNA